MILGPAAMVLFADSNMLLSLIFSTISSFLSIDNETISCLANDFSINSLSSNSLMLE